MGGAPERCPHCCSGSALGVRVCPHLSLVGPSFLWLGGVLPQPAGTLCYLLPCSAEPCPALLIHDLTSWSAFHGAPRPPARPHPGKSLCIPVSQVKRGRWEPLPSADPSFDHSASWRPSPATHHHPPHSASYVRPPNPRPHPPPGSAPLLTPHKARASGTKKWMCLRRDVQIASLRLKGHARSVCSF